MELIWTGERVRLRPFASADELNDLLEELTLEPDEIWGYGWWVRSRITAAFNENGKIGDAGTWSIFAVDRLDTGELVGYEVVSLPGPHQIDAEIGTVILRRHWSNGFGREAKLLAMCLLFESFPLARVSAATMDKHTRARAGLEACGMRHEGTKRGAAFSLGRRQGVAEYAIFREEWERHPVRRVVRRGIPSGDAGASRE